MHTSTFNPFVLSACAYCIISIKYLHALGVELKLLRQLTGDVMATGEAIFTGELMATGEAIFTGELMATGEAEVQNVQTTCDGRIVISRDHHFACWPSS